MVEINFNPTPEPSLAGAIGQGAIQGINLGFGIQQQRQQQELFQQQQQEAKKKAAYDKAQTLSGLISSPTFKAFSQDQKDAVGKSYLNSLNEFGEYGIDTSNFKWQDNFSEYAKRQKAILEDKNLSRADKAYAVSGVLTEAASHLEKQDYSQLKDAADVAMKARESTLTDYQEEQVNLRRERYNDLDRQRLQKSLEPIQAIQTSLQELETKIPFKLEDYDFKTKTTTTIDPDTGKQVRKAVDLPGVSVPGIGRVSAYSGEARDFRSAFQNIFNQILKIRSGAAVTDPEFIRLQREYAEGRFNAEPEMVNALQRLKRVQKRSFKNTESAFKPEVVDSYRQAGGQTYEDVSGPQTFQNPQAPQPSQAPTLAPPPVAGKVHIITSDGQELYLPEESLPKAKQRDPNLRVIQ